MSLVTGLETFRQAMLGFEDEYTLIGGSACSLLFDEVGQSFRATHDLDIVILCNRNEENFAKAFWSFVTDAGYKCGGRNDVASKYYRFTLPDSSDGIEIYPRMIELFTKMPDFELHANGAHIAPIPVSDAVRSLSAIILEDGYFEFIKENATVIQRVSTLQAIHIIPLKMRAHIDLNRNHSEGVYVSERDLRKHRSDVAKLAGLLSAEARFELSGVMRSDAEDFLKDFLEYARSNTDRKQRMDLLETHNFLSKVYL